MLWRTRVQGPGGKGNEGGTEVVDTKAAAVEAGAEPIAGLESCTLRMVDPDRVASVRRSLIGVEEAERLAALFRLLGDRSRARMLFALAEAGELCVCDLAAAVGVPEASVSQALRLLRTAGVVRARRAGRMVWYRLDDGHVELLLDLSREHLRHGGR